jgi:hypothetical protein
VCEISLVTEWRFLPELTHKLFTVDGYGSSLGCPELCLHYHLLLALLLLVEQVLLLLVEQVPELVLLFQSWVYMPC